MKILFVIPSMKCGGAERVAVTIAKCLPEHDIKFINLGHPEGELTHWINPYFQTISLDCNRSLTAYRKLKRIIAKELPDFVFSTHFHIATILMLISKPPTTKVVIRIPTMPSNEQKEFKIKVLEILERRLFRKAYKIIAQTEEMKDEICDMLNVNASIITVIHNPLDTTLIAKQTSNITNPFDETKTNYLSVGNISFAKAYDTLIESFNIVSEKDSKAQLYILGRTDSEYAEKITALANGNDNIHFEGFCENPYRYMKYCSAFVLSSRMEGLPNVVLEAMYLNRPVAATTCVPIIDQLINDGINGYKAEPDNAQSLASAMQQAVQLHNIHNDGQDESNIIKIKKIFE
ncbi:MAG: glycosyltransferase [Bacteroidales bacterium]|nr:glycosyltransferase [Bacteroidales bacterium]